MRSTKIYLSILLLGVSILSNGQMLTGKYNVCDPSGLTCQRFEFNEGRFNVLYAGDLGPKVKSTGYYLFVKDTLVMFHDNRVGSKLTVERKEALTDFLGNPMLSTHLVLKVVDEKGNKMEGVNVVFQTLENKTISALMTNKDGEATFDLSPTTTVHHILCSWLSDEAKILISDFAGTSSIVKVKLSTQSVKESEFTGTEKYLFKKLSSEKLQFQKVGSGLIMHLNKIK